MTRDEWSELAAALADSWKYSGVQIAGVGVQGDAPGNSQDEVAESPQQNIETIVRRVVEMQATADTRKVQNELPVSQSRTGSVARQDSSLASDVLKTAGMVTGVGPIVTGLIKLFGGGSDHGTPASSAPVRYQLPSALRVQAGLLSNRSVSEISYAQDNVVRADVQRTASRENTAAAPAIQIQVNAMDSRSFLDHSDEIAQAVRAAMLRSHALNDVVSEL